MISAAKINSSFVGPRALFDQFYIPPQILYRKNEEKSLFSILKDSFSDNFSLNILYQGIQGIGKKVIINKVIRDLSLLNPELSNIRKGYVDCRDKNLEEIIITLLTEIGFHQNINFNFKSLINSNISDLWNIFKLTCKKSDDDLLFVFNNIEYLKPEFFKKFLQYGKESNISLVSTGNQVLKSSTLDILSEFDIRKKLNYFSYKELHDIIKQRISLTFKYEVDKELIEFITDLIFEHHVPVPGKGIEILRDLYPFLSKQVELSHLETFEILQNQFESLQITDEFSMLSYISEAELLTIIFLDNLSNYFLKNSNFYITIDELKELYYISCESIDFEKNIEEFKHLITTLRNIGILNASKKNTLNDFRFFNENILNYNFYFMVINPQNLKHIVDAIFNNHENF
jgi:Cdc6-like AAA superfamily ATPase